MMGMMPTEQSKYPWYETVEGESIEQGELLIGFEVLISKNTEGSPSVEIRAVLRKLNFVVLTQTCDNEQGKVSNLLLCPWWDFWQFVDEAKSRGENWGSDIQE